MTQGKASKEEAKKSAEALNEIMKSIEALNEIMKSMSMNKCEKFIGHFNDIFLFLTACQQECPSESTESK